MIKALIICPFIALWFTNCNVPFISEDKKDPAPPNNSVIFDTLHTPISFFEGQIDTVRYTESDQDFPNPERGFWGQTVVHKYIELGNFKSSPISADALLSIEKDFDNIRKKKQKVIPRFRYTNSGNGDASLEWVLNHLDQLAPIFNKHMDVIYYVEVGFIGAYGEWWGAQFIKTMADRRTVLKKLLSVVPKDRMVAIRYNSYKRALLNSNDPITEAEAFSGTDRARTGYHNDCFAVNEDDAGTYRNKDDVEGWGLGIEAEKSFVAAENVYLPQGGETCWEGSVAYASCDRALEDLKRFKWDNLNESFNETIIQQWKDQKCYDEIRRKLGYRLVLEEAVFEKKTGDKYFDALIKIKNVGFGKMVNPRKAEIVLRNTKTQKEHILPLNIDPRLWFPGTSKTLRVEAPLPTEVVPGEYQVFLNLPDPAPSLNGIPQYSIQVADSNTWEPSKGYNNLRHSVLVE